MIIVWIAVEIIDCATATTMLAVASTYYPAFALRVAKADSLVLFIVLNLLHHKSDGYVISA